MVRWAAEGVHQVWLEVCARSNLAGVSMSAAWSAAVVNLVGGSGWGRATAGHAPLHRTQPYQESPAAVTSRPADAAGSSGAGGSGAGSSGAGGSGAGGSSAAEPAGMRMYLSQIREWVRMQPRYSCWVDGWGVSKIV